MVEGVPLPILEIWGHDTWSSDDPTFSWCHCKSIILIIVHLVENFSHHLPLPHHIPVPQAREDSEMEEEAVAEAYSLEDLHLLVDYFYLPHQHGERALHILKEFCWLKENAPGGS